MRGGLGMAAQRSLVPGLNVLEQADTAAAAGKKANGHMHPGLPVPPAPVTRNLISTLIPKAAQPKPQQNNGELPSADQWPQSLK